MYIDRTALQHYERTAGNQWLAKMATLEILDGTGAWAGEVSQNCCCA